jgi:lactate permease
MFQQLLTPIGDSLGLSFVVAILPIIAVLVLLGVLRRPAWQAALAGLIAGLIIAVIGWKMPVGLAIDSVLNGAVFALWPVMWIVINALLLYNIAVRSGRFDAFRNWVVCPTTGASSSSSSASASAHCWKAFPASARLSPSPVHC